MRTRQDIVEKAVQSSPKVGRRSWVGVGWVLFFWAVVVDGCGAFFQMDSRLQVLLKMGYPIKW